MSDGSPDETIRRAAARMRELAQAAPQSPWWTGAGVGGTGYPKFIRNEECIFVLAEWQQSGSWPAAGDYIASMHPLVALAVADWLDAAAGPQGSVAGLCHALAVARAYLGDGTEEQQRGEERHG